jgi:uncharacterized integral membrane protein
MSEQSPTKKSEINWNLIAKLLVFGLILIFFIQLKNMPETTWSFLIFEFTWPTWLVLLVTFLLGAFFGRDVWVWIVSKFRKTSV